MITHVKVLAWLHIAFGALAVLGGIVVLVVLGGIAGLVGVADTTGDARVAVPILGGIGTFVFLLLTILGVPGIIAGFGLLRFAPWARILTLVLSALDLLNVPIGTVLGVYGLWVLTKREAEALFQQQSLARPAGY